MEKGFKDSAFRLNDFVKNCDQWTETEMIQRQQDLLLVIKKLWPMPTSNFHVTKQEAETASLDDEDFEFAGKKLQAYTFLGVRHSVSIWKDMLIQVCRQILLEKRAIIEWLCANEKCGFDTTSGSYNHELATNIYVWTSNSTASKIDILRGLFSECNIPASELIFEFRSEQDEDSIE